MSVVVKCDVCGNDYSPDQWDEETYNLSLHFPRRSVGDVGVEYDNYDVCSWGCLLTLASDMYEELEDEEAEEEPPKKGPIFVPAPEPVPSQFSGGYVVQNMRVDGKPV